MEIAGVATMNIVDNPQISNAASTAISSLVWGRTGEWWDYVLVISVSLAAVAALAVGAATAGSVLAHKREAKNAEIALERYKADAGGKIADASKAASDAAVVAYSAGKQAGDAQGAAAKAQADTAKANARVKEAQAQSDIAKRDAAKANERAAALEAEASQANLALEGLRRDNLKIQDRIKPRTFSLNARNSIVDFIKKILPTKKIVITSFGGDIESEQFARNIGDILFLADINYVFKPAALTPSSGTVRGLLISAKPDLAARALAATFNINDVYAEPDDDGRYTPSDPDELLIVVGPRPVPFWM